MNGCFWSAGNAQSETFEFIYVIITMKPKIRYAKIMCGANVKFEYDTEKKNRKNFL